MPYVLTYIAMDDEDQVTTNDQSENDMYHSNCGKKTTTQSRYCSKSSSKLGLKRTTNLKIDGHE